MPRVRRNWMMGVVFGWAAARCCVPAAAQEVPVLVPVPATQVVTSPAPQPVQFQTSVPTAGPVSLPFGSAPSTVPFGQPVPVPQAQNPTPATTQTFVNGQLVNGQPNAAPNNNAIEVITERYPNKQTAIERHVARDAKQNYVNHGTWTMWDPQGRELCKGDFYQGKATGKWTRHFLAGGEDSYTGPEYDEFTRPFHAEATYADDKLVGQWTLSDDQGRMIHSWDFAEDRLNGKTITLFANGKTRREATYRNSILDGESIEFDRDGNRVAVTVWQAGRKLGPTTQRYPSGAKYSQGEYFYAREEKDAAYDFFKGEIHADKLGKKGSDARHGHWTWWYEDGEKMCEGDFADGKAVGHHVWFHPNGQKQMEGDFDGGKRSGTWMTWHINGQKKSEGNYVAGKESGQWFEWMADGKVASQVNHDGSNRFFGNPSGPQPNQVPQNVQYAGNQQFPGGVQPFAGQLKPGQYVKQVGPNEYVIQGQGLPEYPGKGTAQGQGQRTGMKPLVEYIPRSVKR